MTTASTIIEWRADAGEWLFTLPGGIRQNLETWAAAQPELSAVSLVLSAANYTAHWISMPGVKGRNVARALPFALEEVLIGDIGDFTVIPSGSARGAHRAYVVATELLDNLQEALELHHLRLVSLTPQTAMLTSPQIARSGAGWLFSVAGRFEGVVPESAGNAAIEYLCDGLDAESITIVGDTLDQANLLRTTISTGYPQAFTVIDVRSGQAITSDSQINLLHGRVAQTTEARPAAWWRGLAAFAAIFTVFGCAYLFVANHQLSSRIEQVSDASLNLYKSWFPGERTSNYEALFKRKLRSEDGAGGGQDFASMMAEVATAWSAGSRDTVQVISIRYSDRMGEFLLDVTAKAQGDLQTFKQAIEARGLTAEISSATADKDVIKGRVKVGGAA